MTIHAARYIAQNERHAPSADVVIRLADLVVVEFMRLPVDQRGKATARLIARICSVMMGAEPIPSENSVSSSHLAISGHEVTLDDLAKVQRVSATMGRGVRTEPWVLKRIEHILISPGERKVRLSGREFILLEALAISDGHQASRSSISKIFGYDNLSPATRSLDSLIYRLRQKARAASLTLPLNNIHAVGIRFTAPLQVL